MEANIKADLRKMKCGLSCYIQLFYMFQNWLSSYPVAGFSIRNVQVLIHTNLIDLDFVG
jgi:hypothetical protein